MAAAPRGMAPGCEHLRAGVVRGASDRPQGRARRVADRHPPSEGLVLRRADASVQSAPLHFSLHLLIFGTALVMWMPVCGPLPELRLSLPGQMFYLFCQSIIPTIPSAWLIFAEKPLYSAYDTPNRLWGIDAVN